MNSSDTILQKQRLLSWNAGTGRLLPWVIVAAVLVAAGSGYAACRDGKSIAGAMAGPLLVISSLTLSRAWAVSRRKELQAELAAGRMKI